jgi:hypothetical protein
MRGMMIKSEIENKADFSTEEYQREQNNASGSSSINC